MQRRPPITAQDSRLLQRKVSPKGLMAHLVDLTGHTLCGLEAKNWFPDTEQTMPSCIRCTRSRDLHFRVK